MKRCCKLSTCLRLRSRYGPHVALYTRARRATLSSMYLPSFYTGGATYARLHRTVFPSDILVFSREGVRCTALSFEGARGGLAKTPRNNQLDIRVCKASRRATSVPFYVVDFVHACVRYLDKLGRYVTVRLEGGHTCTPHILRTEFRITTPKRTPSSRHQRVSCHGHYPLTPSNLLRPALTRALLQCVYSALLPYAQRPV